MSMNGGKLETVQAIMRWLGGPDAGWEEEGWGSEAAEEEEEEAGLGLEGAARAAPAKGALTPLSVSGSTPYVNVDGLPALWSPGCGGGWHV